MANDSDQIELDWSNTKIGQKIFDDVLITNAQCIRDDYKFVEMIGQKSLLGILSYNLIGHPYITLERQCISGRTYSQNDLKNVRGQIVIIVSVYVSLDTIRFIEWSLRCIWYLFKFVLHYLMFMVKTCFTKISKPMMMSQF